MRRHDRQKVPSPMPGGERDPGTIPHGACMPLAKFIQGFDFARATPTRAFQLVYATPCGQVATTREPQPVDRPEDRLQSVNSLVHLGHSSSCSSTSTVNPERQGHEQRGSRYVDHHGGAERWTSWSNVNSSVRAPGCRMSRGPRTLPFWPQIALHASRETRGQLRFKSPRGLLPQYLFGYR